MILKRLSLFIAIGSIAFCNSCTDHSESKCNSDITVNLMYLVNAKSDIVKEKGLSKYDSIKSYLEVIDKINKLSFNYLEQTGGFKPNTNELVDPCSTRKDLRDIYNQSDISDISKDLKKLNKSSPYYKSFKFILSNYFSGDSPMFDQSYFDEKVTHEVCADLFVVQLFLYDVILFPVLPASN